ncbi:hypothetical protein V511_07425 [Mesotoga sp. Brook.08.YT.4.2.5.1]|jgi:hypothetical protein|uniref:hypothetical protein n=1 Tax=unclassified Mesotoga TaxID=1184398 RepID=UPI000C191539|nr:MULTISPECIES: hypothetical protein [unclassified Mesotoga]PNE22764.1 hypothetical protein V511_07425 [Mesotoga sp. Brook.08.YT.4.2.5.1]PNS42444.1 hypothetical protein RJ60_02005 [Mesotoga sp. B105.6.4]PVD17629.1 hypothetical protein V512_012050 [Mesotoga sp. Brook.08.105.5.1]RAO95922.1 hypothetical protein M388_05340 [Mesotoga sp. Brook.08.YT.4.2.5.4.]RDI94278.1 hypothetical protein Q502_02025 [Mesotoga sp. Brook.08.YT.4.2.5.2.]
MKSELMKVLDDFSVEEAYYAAGEAIPTFVIVSMEPENLLQKIGEMEEIEADIIVISPDERKKLESADSDMSRVVMSVIESGEKLL